MGEFLWVVGKMALSLFAFGIGWKFAKLYVGFRVQQIVRMDGGDPDQILRLPATELLQQEVQKVVSRAFAYRMSRGPVIMTLAGSLCCSLCLKLLGTPLIASLICLVLAGQVPFLEVARHGNAKLVVAVVGALLAPFFLLDWFSGGG